MGAVERVFSLNAEWRHAPQSEGRIERTDRTEAAQRDVSQGGRGQQTESEGKDSPDHPHGSAGQQ